MSEQRPHHSTRHRLGRRAFIGSAAGMLLTACQPQRQPLAAEPSPEATRSAATPLASSAPSPLAAPAAMSPSPGDELGTPTADELARAARWAGAAFEAAERRVPVSLRFTDREAQAVLPEWQAEWTSGPAHAGVSRSTLTLLDPETGLQCRCLVATYADFPAIEWVVSFANTGAADSPMLADIQPLDVVFALQPTDPARLDTANGGQAKLDDVAPCSVQLDPGSEQLLTPADGRTSSEILRFFNLHLGDGGVIAASGWSGRWAAGFSRADDGSVHARAGMAQTHLKLRPGEEIRMPRILLVFWDQHWLHGHNMLRRFVLAHHTPRPNGELLKAPICDNHWSDRCARDQIDNAQFLKRMELAVDYLWIDARWHGDALHQSSSGALDDTWYKEAGNWYPRASTYPDGLKPGGDALKVLDVGFLLWFEPERVYRGTKRSVLARRIRCSTACRRRASWTGTITGP